MSRRGVGGPLLAQRPVDDYRPLGAFGQPAYLNFAQVRAAVLARLGPVCADFFSVPHLDPESRQMSWHAHQPGAVSRWTGLDPAEQMRVALDLETIRAGISGYVAELRSQAGGNGEAYASLLEQAVRIPDDENLFVVAGRPVAAFWSFESRDGTSIEAPAIRPPLGRPITLSDAAPIRSDPDPRPDASVVPAAPPPARRWWAWLLGVLLLLLLLALVALPSCREQSSVPSGVAPLPTPRQSEGSAPVQPRAPDNVLEDPSKAPSRESPLPAAVNQPGAIVSPGSSVARDWVLKPGSERPAGSDIAVDPVLVPGAIDQNIKEPDKGAVLPSDRPAGVPPGPQPSADGRTEPRLDPGTDPPPIQPHERPEGTSQTPGLPSDGSRAQSLGQPLEVPGDAAPARRPEFLDGNWQAGEPLYHSAQQQTYDLTLSFGKQGEGEVQYRRRSDGVVCRSNVKGGMVDGQLQIRGTAPARCPDGSTLPAPVIDCTRQPTGETRCLGRNPGAPPYDVDISRRP